MSFFYSICVLFHSLVHFLYSFCVLFVKSFNLFLMLVSTLCLSISFFFSCPFLYVFFLSFHLFLLCVCYLVCLSLYLISKMLFIPLTTNLCHLYFFVSPSSSSSTFFVHPPPNHWLQIVRGRADWGHTHTHFHFKRPQLFILLMQHLASCWTLHLQSEEHDLHLHLFEVNLLWVFGPEIKVVKPLTLSTDKLRSLKIYLPVANLLKHSMIVIYAFRVVV